MQEMLQLAGGPEDRNQQAGQVARVTQGTEEEGPKWTTFSSSSLKSQTGERKALSPHHPLPNLLREESGWVEAATAPTQALLAQAPAGAPTHNGYGKDERRCEAKGTKYEHIPSQSPKPRSTAGLPGSRPVTP